MRDKIVVGPPGLPKEGRDMGSVIAGVREMTTERVMHHYQESLSTRKCLERRIEELALELGQLRMARNGAQEAADYYQTELLRRQAEAAEQEGRVVRCRIGGSKPRCAVNSKQAGRASSINKNRVCAGKAGEVLAMLQKLNLTPEDLAKLVSGGA